MVSAASASPIRHAARSRGPTRLEIVRSSANGTPAAAAAYRDAVPLHRLRDGVRVPAGRWRARSAVPVTVAHREHLTGHRLGSAARSRPRSAGSAVAAAVPKPSRPAGGSPSGTRRRGPRRRWRWPATGADRRPPGEPAGDPGGDHRAVRLTLRLGVREQPGGAGGRGRRTHPDRGHRDPRGGQPGPHRVRFGARPRSPRATGPWWLSPASSLGRARWRESAPGELSPAAARGGAGVGPGARRGAGDGDRGARGPVGSVGPGVSGVVSAALGHRLERPVLAAPAAAGHHRRSAAGRRPPSARDAAESPTPPHPAGNGIRPTAPPPTKASMSSVSEWANAVARSRSLMRSCIDGVDRELRQAAEDRRDQAEQQDRRQRELDRG